MLTSQLRVDTTRQMIYASRWAWGFALLFCAMAIMVDGAFVWPTLAIAAVLVGIVAWWHVRGKAFDALHPDPEFGPRTQLRLRSYRRQAAMVPMYWGLALVQGKTHLKDGRLDWFWLVFVVLLVVMTLWVLVMVFWLPRHPPRQEKPLRRPEDISPATWRRNNAVLLSVMIVAGVAGAALVAWGWPAGPVRNASWTGGVKLFGGVILLTAAFMALALYAGGLVRDPTAWIHPTTRQAMALVQGIALTVMHVPIALLGGYMVLHPRYYRWAAYLLLFWGVVAMVAGIVITCLAFVRARRNQAPAILPDPYGRPSAASPASDATPPPLVPERSERDERRGPDSTSG